MDALTLVQDPRLRVDEAALFEGVVEGLAHPGVADLVQGALEGRRDVAVADVEAKALSASVIVWAMLLSSRRRVRLLEEQLVHALAASGPVDLG